MCVIYICIFIYVVGILSLYIFRHFYSLFICSILYFPPWLSSFTFSYKFIFKQPQLVRDKSFVELSWLNPPSNEQDESSPNILLFYMSGCDMLIDFSYNKNRMCLKWPNMLNSIVQYKPYRKKEIIATKTTIFRINSQAFYFSITKLTKNYMIVNNRNSQNGPLWRNKKIFHHQACIRNNTCKNEQWETNFAQKKINGIKSICCYPQSGGIDTEWISKIYM